MRRRHAGRRAVEVAWVTVLGGGVGVAGVALALPPVNTTLPDFFQRGTQPGTLGKPLWPVMHNCSMCHGGFDEGSEPFTRWAASMMGQAARDPIFHACLAVANQDASFAGEMCLRCHTPGGWSAGRSSPPDGSGLLAEMGDFEGVSCSACHRMVDHEYTAGENPARDEGILAALNSVTPEGHQNGVPVHPGGGNYVLDPEDYRRGPLDLSEHWGEFTFHFWARSPYHLESRMCATCHDVSNPALERQPDGTYALGALNSPHPTQNKFDQFPIERTYSEWAQSLFAAGPVEMGGRFGGNITAVSSCQDCHMPKTEGELCLPLFGSPTRPHASRHDFNGANSWVLRAVHALYPPGGEHETGLTDESVSAAVARNVSMLERASDMQLTQYGPSLNVRVINQTGHKLPTGYGEGRRMWVNVRFYDAQDRLLAERGVYDPATASFDGTGTKVYETKHGLDAALAAATGRPEGPGFHFAINNKIFFDNRIPPMGSTIAGLAAVQAEPVGYAYADGQHWDDTAYVVPPLAARADVAVYHQTTTKEYIEFLRDQNTTNTAGQVAYDLWQQFGRSVPVEMDSDSVTLTVCAADWDRSGAVNSSDISAFLTAWLAALAPQSIGVDVNGDGGVNSSDISVFLTAWLAGVQNGC